MAKATQGSKVDRLHRAGVIHKELVPDKIKKRFEKLTDAEVDKLIDIRGKLCPPDTSMGEICPYVF